MFLLYPPTRANPKTAASPLERRRAAQAGATRCAVRGWCAVQARSKLALWSPRCPDGASTGMDGQHDHRPAGEHLPGTHGCAAAGRRPHLRRAGGVLAAVRQYGTRPGRLRRQRLRLSRRVAPGQLDRHPKSSCPGVQAPAIASFGHSDTVPLRTPPAPAPSLDTPQPCRPRLAPRVDSSMNPPPARCPRKALQAEPKSEQARAAASDYKPGCTDPGARRGCGTPAERRAASAATQFSNASDGDVEHRAPDQPQPGVAPALAADDTARRRVADVIASPQIR